MKWAPEKVGNTKCSHAVCVYVLVCFVHLLVVMFQRAFVPTLHGWLYWWLVVACSADLAPCGDCGSVAVKLPKLANGMGWEVGGLTAKQHDRQHKVSGKWGNDARRSAMWLITLASQVISVITKAMYAELAYNNRSNSRNSSSN